MQRNLRDLREIEIIASSFKRRFTGVTSTVNALLPVQVRTRKIAAFGFNLPVEWPQVSWRNFLRHAWQPPAGRRFRIWHARRNREMIAGLFFKKALRVPLKLVFTSDAQRDHTQWTKFLIRNMDAVIAGSPEAGSYLKVAHTVVLHGVDMEKYRPATNRQREWAETGLPGKYGIGIFGRVRAQKGSDRFVDAMCELLPRFPEFTAVLVGGVTADQASFADKLKRQIAAAGLEKRILFLGERPAAEVPLWLRRVSIVVSPQRWEGFGLVPIEGMASGSAVVATRVGAARHLIIDGVTAFLVDNEDTGALKQRIEQLMSDEPLRMRLGEQGRKHVDEHFSIQREADGIGAVYDALFRAG